MRTCSAWPRQQVGCWLTLAPHATAGRLSIRVVLRLFVSNRVCDQLTSWVKGVVFGVVTAT